MAGTISIFTINVPISIIVSIISTVSLTANTERMNCTFSCILTIHETITVIINPVITRFKSTGIYFYICIITINSTTYSSFDSISVKIIISAACRYTFVGFPYFFCCECVVPDLYMIYFAFKWGSFVYIGCYFCIWCFCSYV